MLNIDAATISSFLGGSLITLIIKELISQWNKRQDFKLEIKRITYIRKLDKAERAIAYYWTYIDQLLQMKKSFEILLNLINELEESDKDIEMIQQLINRNSQVFMELSSEKYFDVNSIHLYFDLEDEKLWNEDDLGELLTAMNEAKSIDTEIKFWVQQYNFSSQQGDHEKADIYWRKAIEKLPTYISQIEAMLGKFEKNRKQVLGQIQIIKNQLKL